MRSKNGDGDRPGGLFDRKSGPPWQHLTMSSREAYRRLLLTHPRVKSANRATHITRMNSRESQEACGTHAMRAVCAVDLSDPALLPHPVRCVFCAVAPMTCRRAPQLGNEIITQTVPLQKGKNRQKTSASWRNAFLRGVKKRYFATIKGKLIDVRPKTVSKHVLQIAFFAALRCFAAQKWRHSCQSTFQLSTSKKQSSHGSFLNLFLTISRHLFHSVIRFSEPMRPITQDWCEKGG